MYSGSGNSSDANPLYVACIAGHLEIASYLVSKNMCDVDGVFIAHGVKVIIIIHSERDTNTIKLNVNCQ